MALPKLQIQVQFRNDDSGKPASYHIYLISKPYKLLSSAIEQLLHHLTIALRISKITKSKGPDFAQFQSKPSEAVWDRQKLSKYSGKFFLLNIQQNVALMDKKHEGGDCQC